MITFPKNTKSYVFPNPLDSDDEGLLAYGGDLNPNRILSAYMKGIFPWYNSDEPILWWSPNPRFILKLDEFKISKSLKKTINKNIFEIRFDTNFKQVMTECAKIKRKEQSGTWIQTEIIEAYTQIYKMGFAHSFEAYYKNELVGGGYGLCIGDIFCGESMFSKKTDASKVAFYFLVQRLKKQKFSLIDCQIPSLHLASLGAKEIKREVFLDILKKSLDNLKEF